MYFFLPKIISFTLMLILLHITPNLACTIFSVNNQGIQYFCNNEDWKEPNTRFWFRAETKTKYGCVFFGFDNYWAQGGMNERGLCFDWVAYALSPVHDNVLDPTKMTYNGNLSQKILEECATVDEAIEYYSKYNEESFSYANIMITDKAGNSAIVGWKDKQLYIERGNSNYQITGYGRNKIMSLLRSGVDFTLKDIAGMMDLAHQDGTYATKYTNINDLTNDILYLFHEHNFNEFIKFSLKDELKHGHKNYDLPAFFSKIEFVSPVGDSLVNPARVDFKWQGKIESTYHLYCAADSLFSDVEPIIIESPVANSSQNAQSGIFLMIVLGIGFFKRRRKKSYRLIFLSLFVLLMLNCNHGDDVTEPTLGGVQEISKILVDLQPNTTYYWKIEAFAQGTNHFPTETFLQKFTTGNTE